MTTNNSTSATARPSTGQRLSTVQSEVRPARIPRARAVACAASATEISSAGPEETAGPHQQHERYQREHRDLGENRKEQACQTVDHADEQSAEHGTPVAAQAADD